MADGITAEELRIKIGVFRAAIKAALDTDPYNPIALEASIDKLQQIANNLEAAHEKL
jgi:hypothetical protein